MGILMFCFNLVSVLSALMDLKQYWKIDMRTKFLVNGFIRKIQMLFSKNNFYFCQFPGEINHVCSIFYYQYDEWDTNLTGTFLKIDNKTVTNAVDLMWSTSFLTKVVEYGKHYWTFKIKYHHENEDDFIIGIWNDSSDKKLAVNINIGEIPRTTYAFDFGTGELSKYETIGWTAPGTYGILCKTGSIIRLNVDFDLLTLSFTINGINYGVSHNIQKGKYTVAVSMQNPNASIELLKYHTF